MSSWNEGSSSSEIEPTESAATASMNYTLAPVRQGRTTLGSLFLYLAVLFVVGISVGALTGYVDPVAGAVIVLGSEVVGTIAFFLTYYIGRRFEKP